jgi:amino acid adenylation domain-containing protein
VWLDHQAAVNWDGGLALNWDSLEHRFPAGAAQEMFEAYVRLLADLSGNDSTWTESRRTLTPASQLAAFERANATDWPLSELCLQQLFYRQCAQTPDAPAIVTADVRIRYRELHASVAALAKRLTPYHLRPGELVAVMMRKGPEQIAACLAIQTAGAAYVPIDPDLPAERIRWLMQRCDVRVVLSQSALDGHAGLPSNDVIFVDRVPGGSEEDCQDVARQTPNDLAYAIFTSGSTGTPKGVVLDHRGPVNTVLDINHRFGVTANDRIFAISSLSFDLSVYDLFGGLAAGAALVMPSAERLKEPAHWHDLIANQRVTVWNSAPALMQMYVDYLADQGLQLPATLRLIMLSGDWIPLSLAKKIRQARPDIRFISLGGATEASIWSIFHEVEHIDPGWRSVPYGKALANQKFFVFDEQLRYRPVGVPGALYIGGVGLAKGYWREPELTSKVFVTHPVTGEPLYRTGDLGRYFEDGSIEFLGREDFQVKLQGYRVELGEIEHCLGRHVSVDTALVTVVGNSTATARLVAYVVPVRGHTCTPRELIDHASRTLPHYMVPMTFVFLDRFPVTANGKIDRKALPQPGAERRGGESSTAAASPTEQAVLSIWRDLLENQEVGVHDNFFDLGGQSFLAVRMMSRVQREFHVTLPISTLLQHPTAALLARHIEESRGPTATQHDPVVVIKSSGRAAPLVLVHPVGGSVLCYQELATALGALDRPILALQAAPSEGSAEVTIEKLAARYVDAVRRRQPQGPYCLGGWSLGGVVAVEMARQLSAAGERVSNLILIDTPLSRATDAPVEGELAAWFFRDATQGRYAGTAAERESWDDHLKHALDLGLLSADTDANALRQHYAVFRDNALALSRYHPSPLAADVPAFTLRATETLADRHAIPHAPDDMTGGWKEFLGAGTRGVQCDGNHYSIMQGSRVRTLAAHIEQLLRGAHDD